MIKFALRPGHGPVAVPKYDASDADVEKMIDGIRDVLKNGYSIVANTDGVVKRQTEKSIEDHGKMLMKTKEWEAYNMWKSGKVMLESWDWTKKEKVEATSVKNWSAKIEALCRMYKKKNLSAEQTKAWVKGNTELHSLMGGMVKMVRAERAQCGGKNNMDLKVVAEKMACTKIRKILADRHSAKVQTDGTTIKKITSFTDELRQHARSFESISA